MSSAVYRYVKSRDELLTLLVVDGYNELGDAAEAAWRPAAEPREQFLALGRAVREWALREPARYGLLFGSPVPGYQRPASRPRFRDAGDLRPRRNLRHRVPGGRLEAAAAAPIDDQLAADLDRIRAELGLTTPDPLLARGVLVWSALFGAVNFEVFGQYGADTFTTPGALFEHHLAVLAETAGLPAA